MKPIRILIYLALGFFSMSVVAETTASDSDSNAYKQHLSYPQSIVLNYADLVYRNYSAALEKVQALDEAINQFLVNPSEQTFAAAKDAWLLSRVPYLQSEVFRFYGGPIDDEDGPEGLLNAWPLDEAYVDYVAGSMDSGFINNPQEYPIITEDLLVRLNEKNGEENISAGFHAIEFLLWGQDLYKDSPGKRSHLDYVHAPNAQRRSIALRLMSKRLVRDLQFLVDTWAPNKKNYRKSFLAFDVEIALAKILTGIIMISGPELAEERLFVAYSTQLQEDEHSCFSDSTHMDAIHNAQGILNVFEGNYGENKANAESQASIYGLIESIDESLARQTHAQMQQSIQLAKALEPPFDQLILKDNNTGRASVKALIDSLRTQEKLIRKCAELLGLLIGT